MDWSEGEVDLVVDAYFGMLASELAGEPYVKAEVRRKLLEQIDRTGSSIEFKFQNVSAALVELGGIPIDGYKPMRNAQQLLRDRVALRFADSPEVRSLMMHAVDMPPASVSIELGEAAEVPAVHVLLGEGGGIRRGRFVDFQQRETANRALGLAGEKAVVRLERRRLTLSGESRLAERVRHVSVEDGDGLGYDVLSFGPTGEERFIEVKTTRSAKEMPFHVTRNEVAFSAEVAPHFRLYRLFQFERAGRQGHYELSGALDESLVMVPEVFTAVPRATGAS